MKLHPHDPDCRCGDRSDQYADVCRHCQRLNPDGGSLYPYAISPKSPQACWCPRCKAWLRDYLPGVIAQLEADLAAARRDLAEANR